MELKPVEQTYKVGKKDVDMKVKLGFGKSKKSFGLHVISNQKVSETEVHKSLFMIYQVNYYLRKKIIYLFWLKKLT